MKFDGVEVYNTGRYFTSTGACILGKEIKAAPAEVATLVNEVRANEAAAKQQTPGYANAAATTRIEVPESFDKPAEEFASLDPSGLSSRWHYDRLV